MTTDCTAMVDKFKNLHCAPSKARSDIEPCRPDQLVNISDIVYCIEGFIGLSCPFEPNLDPCAP
jgi:hypothetical protein